MKDFANRTFGLANEFIEKLRVWLVRFSYAQSLVIGSTHFWALHSNEIQSALCGKRSRSEGLATPRRAV